MPWAIARSAATPDTTGRASPFRQPPHGRIVLPSMSKRRRRDIGKMPVSPEVPLPADDSPDERAHRRELARGVRNALQGKTNNTGSVTLTASSTTTTLTDARIGAASVILFM